MTRLRQDIKKAVPNWNGFFCAGGETRTLMDLSPGDFESPASTNFTTPAKLQQSLIYIFFTQCQGEIALTFF